MATTVVADHKTAVTSVARKAGNLSTTIALFVVASRGGHAVGNNPGQICEAQFDEWAKRIDEEARELQLGFF